ncbi:MAG: hypothetical protein KME59_00475 [Trichormus sp. ATA11-4-KO1]|nr:hypothetical protein [Trichormus sp. ATA11-4-KO1]
MKSHKYSFKAALCSLGLLLSASPLFLAGSTAHGKLDCRGENPAPICINPPTPRLISQARPPEADSMPVTIELTEFICINADEDSFYSNGDEPYLFVAAIYADGTTIDLRKFSDATVRIQSPSKTHGNLRRKGVKAGHRFPIPSSTGRFTNSILPIAGKLPGNLAKEKSIVGLIVIAMEEDATPTKAANAAQRALVKVLKNDLEQTIRNFDEPDIETLKRNIRTAMQNAIKQGTLRRFGIFGFLDPDDYINADFATWSYQEIQDAGTRGIPINMTFKKSGVEYRVTGRVRRGSPAVETSPPCPRGQICAEPGLGRDECRICIPDGTHRP